MADLSNLEALADDQSARHANDGVSSQEAQLLDEILLRVMNEFRVEAANLVSAEAKSFFLQYFDDLKLPLTEVTNLAIGAVSTEFERGRFFDSAISQFRDKTEQRKPGRPRKSSRAPEEIAAFLTAARDELERLAAPGAVAVSLTDGKGRICSIRFLYPDGREALYSPTGSPGALLMNVAGRCSLVLDDPRDALRLRALQLAEPGVVYEGSGRSLTDYQLVLTSSDPDPALIRSLVKPPIVVPSYDLGESLKSQMTIHRPVGAGRIPSMCAFIDEHPTSSSAAAVLRMLHHVEILYRPTESVKAEIDEIRRNPDRLKEFEVTRAVAEVVRADVYERGALYYNDQDCFLFLKAEKRLIVLDPENESLERLFFAYGLLIRDEISLRVVDTLKIHAREDGSRTTVYLFSHYATTAHTLYINNFAQQMHRIRRDRVDLVDNGTDGILFADEPRWEPYNIDLARAHDAPSVIDPLLFDSVEFAPAALSSREQRTLFRIWLFTLFFPELFRTKVILVLFGERGSRKTSTLRRVGCVLFGSQFNVTPISHDSKDFDAAITQTHFVVLDNADTRVGWIEDRLAVAATGARLKLRKLYTTMTMVEYQIKAFLALTSRTPHFRREDVADRLLLLKPTRIESFISESKLQAEVLSRRDEAMTEIVQELQRIVGILKDSGDGDEPTTFRMADFATFALKIAKAEGREADMQSILKHTSEDQASFGLEGEPIFELLQDWITRRLPNDKGYPNIGREVTSTDLCDELSKIADWRKMDFYLAGKSRAFAQRLRNVLPALRKFFEIREREGRGHRKYFSFRPLWLGDEAEQADLFTTNDDDDTEV